MGKYLLSYRIVFLFIYIYSHVEFSYFRKSCQVGEMGEGGGGQGKAMKGNREKYLKLGYTETSEVR